KSGGGWPWRRATALLPGPRDRRARRLHPGCSGAVTSGPGRDRRVRDRSQRNQPHLFRRNHGTDRVRCRRYVRRRAGTRGSGIETGMTGIVVVAHAPLGEAMREFAMHVLGESGNLMAVHDVQPDDMPEDVVPAVLHDIRAADRGKGVLVLT